MRKLTIITAIISLILFSFMLICGLWISANGTDAGGIAFHRTLGLAGIAAGTLTSVTALIMMRKMK
jgi:hypothetical protein